jgi:hypothetical protein
MPEGKDTDRGGSPRGADRSQSWREQVAASEAAHRESGEPVIKQTEGGGFSANTPAGIERFRAITARSALRLHAAGLRSKHTPAAQRAAHDILGLEPGTHKGRGANQALLDQLNTHLAEKYGK